MRLIRNTDAQRMIWEQKQKITELLEEHRPTNAEQGMYLAFKIANTILNDCPKATPYWRDVKVKLPESDGLFLVTARKNGRLKTMTVFFKAGKWTQDFDITHWTLLPPPYKEDI